MSEVHERTDDEVIEVFDLGDVTIETKQWSDFANYFDSVFVLGEKDV